MVEMEICHMCHISPSPPWWRYVTCATIIWLQTSNKTKNYKNITLSDEVKFAINIVWQRQCCIMSCSQWFLRAWLGQYLLSPSSDELSDENCESSESKILEPSWPISSLSIEHSVSYVFRPHSGFNKEYELHLVLWMGHDGPWRPAKS